ncbi:hypothetical protein MRB53_019174 [Persea americana]|uniref:Uncharacterized protein n=1 Tax=Persea americana TaxID=3435 RepID=A0ACC2KXN9_PERAE|nr:hypothetical protein MRB53_019174 [Persea americana]|eukprot:TRINITY_DN4460_c0_g2_i1.p1 TRINITY_DN4460_c0_g2~~TRINITY_DN4460_c0_g2_i1.p1  ORF type:complete len:190 (-),score=29.65 TRINITY_DN4460_c0_g2_i1:105-674(-)
MVGSTVIAAFLLIVVLALPAMSNACGYCNQPPKSTHPPVFRRPPRSSSSPSTKPPVVIVPPVIINPPATNQPPPAAGGSGNKPPSGAGGGVPSTNPSPSSSEKCPADTLKLGLCVDALGGLVHAGLGDPVVNTCCPVIGGLLELEAAVCLCTTLRIKLLNLNIVIPLTIQALISCGKNLPPAFVCPPPS